MTAHFYQAIVYGKLLVYPSKNCSIAQAICSLIGQKTINLGDKQNFIEQLGITVDLTALPQ